MRIPSETLVIDSEKMPILSEMLVITPHRMTISSQMLVIISEKMINFPAPKIAFDRPTGNFF
jgi:aromatic ring-opening dioxygenase LigB subunit